MKRSAKTPTSAFQSAVWEHYKAHGRHDLPWRKTRNPYRILVSEIMLQQTQVSRVLEKYKEFLKAFPTVQKLADAKLSEVLKVWSGLGYNRRGKYLHDAAKIIVRDYDGSVKKATEQRLPGVGPYTRAAVRVFAFNEPHTMIETNIRAVYIHHFASTIRGSTPRSLGEVGQIHDRDLIPLMEAAAAGQDPREWHWALMDYGSHLKKLHENPTRKSAHYGMQTKFKGSLRQVRGAILKLLNDGMYGDLALSKQLSYDAGRVREALFALAKDGLVVAEKGSWRLAS